MGADPEAMIANVRGAIAEADRVLAPGGRLVVAESCVPPYRVPPGRWITQFGRLWPTALTPARGYMVVARKASRSA